MKIVFNLQDVGLGNNGGSRTLVLCAENLANLGHKVVLFGNHKCKYKWHQIDPRVVYVQGDRQPNCDVSIATGYASAKHVAASSAKRKFYYIRGFEVWNTSEKNLLKSYRQLSCIVNSEWLLDYMTKNGIKAKLIYPGLDIGYFHNLEQPRSNLFGAIFHKKHKTKRHEFAIQLQEKTAYRMEMLNKDISAPTHQEQNAWYNTLKVWFAPTELEGLHNPPMESGLAGCALLATDHPRSGMQDYAVHKETALVYKAGDIGMASEYLNWLMADEDLCHRLASNLGLLLKEKIGHRKKNMKIFADHIG